MAELAAAHYPLESDDGSPDKPDLYHISAAVMRIHEAKRFPGGTIASLSIPWGFSKGDDDLGGYHLVWPRDLAETAGGLLAAGAKEDVRKILYYLQATQEADGHWPQNMWLDGRPYWQGIQLDETAFPILLVDLAARQDALLDGDLNRLWPMVRRAASFLVTNGPVTQQDRWEEDPGILLSPWPSRLPPFWQPRIWLKIRQVHNWLLFYARLQIIGMKASNAGLMWKTLIWPNKST